VSQDSQESLNVLNTFIHAQTTEVNPYECHAILIRNKNKQPATQTNE
jgi:hypothetical protein